MFAFKFALGPLLGLKFALGPLFGLLRLMSAASGVSHSE